MCILVGALLITVMSVARMPNTEFPMTGKFLILGVRAEMADAQTIKVLQQLEVQCQSCMQECMLTEGEGLVDVQGAGLLSCPHCGEHQAVSRARFEQFLQMTVPKA
ncbi:hypothetical protein ACTUVK_002396 [Stenotrophomonas rhizophila]|jgi:hypothetical protein